MTEQEVNLNRRSIFKAGGLAVGGLAGLSLLSSSRNPSLAATSPIYGSSPLEKLSNWDDFSLHGIWRTMYNGYGTVKGTNSQVLLSPKPATDPNDTAACMVHTEAWYDDVTFEATIRTEKQLRRNSPPNQWEVGWICWNLRNDTHFYSAQLKPTEWEIGKEDPVYPGAQRFFATGGEVATGANIWRFPVGIDYRMKVQVSGPTSTIWVNGADGSYRKIYSFTDSERPYYGGRIGLYTEDARVWFHDFKILSYKKKSYPGYDESYWKSLNYDYS